MRLKIDLEIPNWTKWLVGGIAIGLIIGVGVVWAAGTPPAPFEASEVLNATKMNANFSGLDARIAALENSAATPLVPTGTVVASFASSPPAGWLVANGSLIDSGSMPQYAALVSLLRGLGTSYQGPSASQAYLPDLRGMFLRGANSGRTDSFANPDGNLSIGATQASSIQQHAHGSGSLSIGSSGNHSHPVAFDVGGSLGYSGGAVSGSGVVASGSRYGTAYAQAVEHSHPSSAFGGETETYGGNETRPSSITVQYLIKY